ncbi:MAG TPA: SpoIID/LytB domain-containing protein [Candidatus Eisenbacteria bacterium]|nr:SpoIID/LytB domain-containing protein [Candidatus Eisenbacteria bacterium]
MAASRRRLGRAGSAVAVLCLSLAFVGASVPGGGPPEPVPDAWRTAKNIRVGLVVGAPSLLLAGSTNWGLSTGDGGRITTAESGERLRIVRMGPAAMEVYRDGVMAPLWTGGPADTLVLTPEGGGYSGWSGRWYRGAFRIHASQPEGLTLVNEVPLESYLRGVLPEEIGQPPESDYEAVKAQAVAARSYTLSYLGRRAALGFDLWASVEDQVYGGTARENSQSNRALQATDGEVLLSEGSPIRALYSSTCGGRTSNVEDVWPWPWTAYLRSVRDADDPGETPYCARSGNFRWREEWDAATFMATLRKFGPAEGVPAKVLAGDLRDVRVGVRSRSGRVQEVIVSTTGGDWALRGDRTRWALRRPGGEAILRSSFLKVGVLRDSGGRPLAVIATGAGNGHGIGLCQWGAMGMARAGKSYKEILGHYYKDTSLAHL